MHRDKFVILSVDDDPDIREALRIVLEANGYVFAEAASAEEALGVYKEAEPDLILLDLMMEEVDAGTNFVKQLQAIGNKAPVYILSGVGDNLNLSTDYAALGLMGILQKPIDINLLLTLLRTKLGEHPAVADS